VRHFLFRSQSDRPREFCTGLWGRGGFLFGSRPRPPKKTGWGVFFSRSHTLPGWGSGRAFSGGAVYFGAGGPAVLNKKTPRGGGFRRGGLAVPGKRAGPTPRSWPNGYSPRLTGFSKSYGVDWGPAPGPGPRPTDRDFPLAGPGAGPRRGGGGAIRVRQGGAFFLGQIPGTACWNF